MGEPPAKLGGWNLSRPDWETRLRAGQSLLPDIPFTPAQRARGEKAGRIFDLLRIPDVPGTPTFAEAGGPWFREIVVALHSAIDIDGPLKERLIRELFLLVPKKNAKTTAGAGLMTTSLLLNERPRAEFLIVAPTQKIAELAYGQIVGMIELEPRLVASFKVQDHKKVVTFLPTGATLQIKSFDPKVMTGVKPSGVLVDELHVIAESPDADRVIGQIRGGIISQPEAFFAFITTQSERPPRGVFKAELAKARAIRDGKSNGKMLPVLYELPRAMVDVPFVPGEDAAWENPAHWHMVTPNNGRSITVDRLVEDYHTAKDASPEELRRWASQHLNVEIGLALRSDAWAGAPYWERAADTELTLDQLLERSEVVCVGIDGGGLDDLLGLAVIGRERVTRRWLHWGHAWAFSGVLERRKAEASVLRDFEKQGDLTIVEQLGDDIAELADRVAEVASSGLLATIGLDPAGVGAVVDALAERGIAGADRVVGVSQGWKLAGAIKSVERKVADGTFAHGGRPIMAWAVGNAKVTPAGNAILITKQAAGSAKIDPLMALFDAAALMSMNPEPPEVAEIYGDGELLMI